METNKPIKRPRKRLVVEIDPDLIDRLQAERIVQQRPVNHIVEEVLARRFEAEPPVVIG